MRVLWLTPELPSSLGAGGGIRQWHMLDRLLAAGHEAVVVAPVHPDEREGAGRLRERGVDLRAYERPPSRVRETLDLLRRRPGLVAAAAREPLVAWQVDVFWTALGPLVPSGPFDVVNVNHDWAADWIRRLDAGAAKRVLTLENITWSYYENRARAASAGRARSAAFAGEARRWRRYDLRRFPEYDALVTVSEHDAELLERETPTRVEAIPSGVDTSALHPGPLPEGAPPALVFTGTMSWPPNAEGLRWLLREVWPRVRDEVPEARLLAVGGGAPEDVRRLAAADDRVELPGRVPELGPWFERASVVVIPILSGAGIRLKVLDALASGRAIVSTTMGAEGAVVRDGEHLVLADDPASFAAATIALLRDPGRAASLGANARRLAEARYDWRVLGDRFEALLRELVPAS
ncbi:MAG TPA: glycosyltransferase family 4 protein [Solirubrobacteraceae bacterium]|nr:glycosyltransferase family 4 protein [Solirubrobacteraceae bacterium]